MVAASSLDLSLTSDIAFKIKAGPSLITDGYELRVHSSSCPREGEGIFRPHMHFIETTLSPAQPVWSSYARQESEPGFRVGKTMFVPIGETVRCHFTAGVRRTVSCLFDLAALGRPDATAWSWDMMDPAKAFDIRSPFVQMALQRLGEEAMAPNFESSFQIESTLLFLAGELRRYFRPDAGRISPDQGGLLPKHLALVRERVEDTTGKMPSLGDLANLTGLGPQSLSARFQKSTGKTLRSYLAATKLERAKRLVLGEELLLKQIAYLSGFGSAATFCLAFRRSTGMTPGEFREKMTGRP